MHVCESKCSIKAYFCGHKKFVYRLIYVCVLVENPKWGEKINECSPIVIASFAALTALPTNHCKYVHMFKYEHAYILTQICESRKNILEL